MHAPGPARRWPDRAPGRERSAAPQHPYQRAQHGGRLEHDALDELRERDRAGAGGRRDLEEAVRQPGRPVQVHVRLERLLNIYSYTGREWDPDAQLYYYRARWFDPVVGRCVSEDPAQFGPGDPNQDVHPSSSLGTGAQNSTGANDSQQPIPHAIHSAIGRSGRKPRQPHAISPRPARVAAAPAPAAAARGRPRAPCPPPRGAREASGSHRG